MRDTQQMTTSPNPTAAGWYPDPSGAPVQRYFDGSDWTQHWAPLVSDAEREEQLNVAVANDVALGARVLSRSRFQAVLLYSGGLSGAAHVVFALLSIFTCGLFLIVWIIAGATSNERRVILTVDANGTVVRA